MGRGGGPPIPSDLKLRRPGRPKKKAKPGEGAQGLSSKRCVFFTLLYFVFICFHLAAELKYDDQGRIHGSQQDRACSQANTLWCAGLNTTNNHIPC